MCAVQEGSIRSVCVKRSSRYSEHSYILEHDICVSRAALASLELDVMRLWEKKRKMRWRKVSDSSKTLIKVKWRSNTDYDTLL